jgi:hypothetical protein
MRHNHRFRIVAVAAASSAFAACASSAPDDVANVTQADWSAPLPAFYSPNVLTQHNDNYRTGQAAREADLTTANVNRATFGKLYARNVDGEIQAQPLYVRGVNVPGVGRKNVVYVATMTNHLYAFDADDYAIDPDAALLRHWYFGPAEPGGPGRCASALSYGITSTPAIDVDTHTGVKTMYFVTKTIESNVPHQRLHALDLETYADRAVEIAAPGFSATLLNRAGLLLNGGNVYVAFGSHCDWMPYSGWVFSYDAASLTRVATIVTTPGGGGGGVWASGNGLPADPAGNVYFQSGNFIGARAGGRDPRDLSESLVHTDARLQLRNRYLATDWARMDREDLDLGSSGPLIIPETGDVVGGGKPGRIYLADHDTMALKQTFKAALNVSNPGLSPEACTYGSSPGTNGSPTSSADLCPHIHSGMTYWRGPDPSFGRVYVWGERDYLRAYHYDLSRRIFVDAVTGAPLGADGTGGAQRSAMHLPLNDPNDGTRIMPAASMSVSSQSDSAGTGIVWATHVVRKNGEYTLVDGMLRAFDAATLAELWNSGIDPSDPEFLGAHAKNVPPTIAGGNVYVATGSGQLVVYGLRARAVGRAARVMVAMGKCLDTQGGGGGNYTPLQTWDCNRNASQQWQMDRGALVHAAGRCADVRDQVNANGTRVQLYDCNGFTGQRWTFTDAAVRGLASKCLDVKDQINARGTAIQSWECNGLEGQKWTFTEAGELRSNFGRCLDVKDQVNANGARLQLWDCNGLAGQKWMLMPGGQIRSRLAPTRCVDVKDVNPNDGAPIQLWDCNGFPSQKWSLRGHVQSAFGRFLDVKDVNPRSGAAIQIWDRFELPSQIWELHP